MTGQMDLYRTLLDDCTARPTNGAAPKLPHARRARALSEALIEAVPFDFSQVDGWLDADFNRIAETRHIYEWFTHLPPCSPPYPIMFVESGFPELYGASVGTLIITSRDPDLSFRSDCYVYGTAPSGALLGPVGCISFHLSPEGEPIAVPAVTPNGVTLDFRAPEHRMEILAPYTDSMPGKIGTSRDRASCMCLYAAAVALFGCSLLHCKNVTERHQRLSRPQSRLRERKNLPPIVWKTLVVGPMPKPMTADDVADSLDERHSRRLHMVRGHFREYGTNGRGKLFGKISGRFWIPPTVKGTAHAGLVIKDYRMKGVPQ